MREAMSTRGGTRNASVSAESARNEKTPSLPASEGTPPSALGQLKRYWGSRSDAVWKRLQQSGR